SRPRMPAAGGSRPPPRSSRRRPRRNRSSPPSRLPTATSWPRRAPPGYAPRAPPATTSAPASPRRRRRASPGSGRPVPGARPEPRDQVRRHRDEALGGELVGHRADPIREPVDLVDHHHDARLVLALGEDDPRAERLVRHVVHVHPFAVTRGAVERRLRAIL